MEMKITVRLLNKQYAQLVVMEGWENWESLRIAKAISAFEFDSSHYLGFF